MSFFAQQPLRRKLPLFISTLVFVVVAVLSGFGYEQVERAMLAATGQRVANAVQQVGGMVHESVLNIRHSAHLLAGDSSISAFLRQETPRNRALVDRVLRGDLARLPPVISRSLWSRSGLRFTLQPNDAGRSNLPALAPTEVLPPATLHAWVGPLRLQQRIVVYDVVAPVVAGADTLGYLVETRRLVTGQSLQFVRDLIGSGASFLLGNSDGSLWTDLSGVAVAPPQGSLPDEPSEYRRGGSIQLGATDKVASTPWLVTIEIPRRIAIAPARQFLYGALVIAVLMIALGAIAAWAMSRSITRPLDDIARAARGIAEGDYSRRTTVKAESELGMLAASFDAMAAKVEASARERESTLTLLDVVLASAPIGFALLDRELRYLRVNDALAQLNGQTPAAHLGRLASELQPELGEEREALLHRVLDDRQAIVDVELVRVGVRNGGDRQLRASFFPIVVANGPPTAIGMFVAETTERRGLEAQLQQAQKMEAVGQLAGGIAHDFNNLLTVITSYGAMVLADIPRESPHAADVQEILNAANRASSLTRQLLAFSRRQVLQPNVLDLNALTGNLEKMLRRLLREDIELVTKFEPKLALVNADAGQLEQVIVNLVVNARDAMARGGRISIETSNVMLGEGYGPMHANAPPGPYALLSVSDTGKGMDKSTQAHIFEPFFTTKPVGQGTGLGLSTVYGIVKQSGGYVWVYSELNRGTTFKVYLPAVAGAPSADDVEREATPAPTCAPERILLVEDEPNVRRIAKRILERHGYTVLEASNGNEALRVMERRQEPIALVLTDLVMPEMGGRELASRLRVVSPTSRVLFMSGYTEDAVLRQSVMEPGAVFLDKPFTFDTLIRKVREALAA